MTTNTIPYLQDTTHHFNNPKDIENYPENYFETLRGYVDFQDKTIEEIKATLMKTGDKGEYYEYWLNNNQEISIEDNNIGLQDLLEKYPKTKGAINLLIQDNDRKIVLGYVEKDTNENSGWSEVIGSMVFRESQNFLTRDGRSMEKGEKAKIFITLQLQKKPDQFIENYTLIAKAFELSSNTTDTFAPDNALYQKQLSSEEFKEYLSYPNFQNRVE